MKANELFAGQELYRRLFPAALVVVLEIDSDNGRAYVEYESGVCEWAPIAELVEA